MTLIEKSVDNEAVKVADSLTMLREKERYLFGLLGRLGTALFAGFALEISLLLNCLIIAAEAGEVKPELIEPFFNFIREVVDLFRTMFMLGLAVTLLNILYKISTEGPKTLKIGMLTTFAILLYPSMLALAYIDASGIIKRETLFNAEFIVLNLMLGYLLVMAIMGIVTVARHFSVTLKLKKEERNE